MSWTNVKQQLRSCSRDELIEHVQVLHEKFPDVRAYYNVHYGQTGGEEVLRTYKEIITHEFFPRSGFGEGRLSVARGVVMKFMKMCDNPRLHADIMVHYVEVGVKYTNAYGDIDEAFYSSMEGMADKAASCIRANHLENDFSDRFQHIVHATRNIGWGFHDELRDIFLEYFGDRERIEAPPAS